jgi:hypothetical protein
MGLTVSNTLAYYDTDLITTVKTSKAQKGTCLTVAPYEISL